MDRKISSIKAVGFLDVMCAFAGYARATGAVKPELTEEIFLDDFSKIIDFRAIFGFSVFLNFLSFFFQDWLRLRY